MIKKIGLVLVAILAFSNLIIAQTTATATWNTADTPALAQGYQTTLKIDAAPVVTLQPNCTLVNAVTTCSALVSGWVSGVKHDLILSVKDSITGNTASAAFTSNPGPAVPTNGKIIVIIIG